MSLTQQNRDWLEARGYTREIDDDLNENFWKKGKVQISIHALRGTEHEFFKASIIQRELEMNRPYIPLQVLHPDPNVLFKVESEPYPFEVVR